MLFRHFDSQQLVVREGHLLDDKHIPVAMSECLSRFQYHRRSKLDSLGVGGLGEFLVNELYPDLIDVETDVRLVLYGKVYEEVVPDRVYVVQAHHHTVCLGGHIPDSRRRVPDPSGKACHLGG